MEDRCLYKAKRLDNREWVVGFYTYIYKKHYIYTGQIISGGLYDIAERFEVDPSTICQCTGLKDKNNKLIWENDIVKINNSKLNTLITFRDFEVICTIPSEKYYKHRLEYDIEYEVVGNIFDNPELLESEE